MFTSFWKGVGESSLGRMIFQRPAPAAPVAVAPRMDESARHAMIALAAYFAAERRGSNGGSAQEDWAAAEIQVDKRLNQDRNG